MRHKIPAYPIGGFFPTVSDCFHDTPFLVFYILHPICLACCDEKMRCPFIDMAIQLIILVDFELGRIMNGARCAIMIAIFPVDSRIHLGEQGALRSLGKGFFKLRDRVGGCRRGQIGCGAMKDGREGCGHCAVWPTWIVGQKGGHVDEINLSI